MYDCVCENNNTEYGIRIMKRERLLKACVVKWRISLNEISNCKNCRFTLIIFHFIAAAKQSERMCSVLDVTGSVAR